MEREDSRRDWITRKNKENDLPPQNIYERPGPMAPRLVLPPLPATAW